MDDAARRVYASAKDCLAPSSGAQSNPAREHVAEMALIREAAIRCYQAERCIPGAKHNFGRFDPDLK
jgi:hypothetical protein